MDKRLAVLTFVVAIVISLSAFPEGFAAVLLCSICALIAVFVISKSLGKDQIEERRFLQQIFIIGLLLRAILATVTYIFELQSFFGGDSITYDIAGDTLVKIWFGQGADVSSYYADFVNRSMGSGVGMPYLVGTIYLIVGRNMLATQLFNSVLGAATAPLIYNCAKSIFQNKRVARNSAIFVAVFPSLILWSSQGLKDGIICFLLALSMSSVLSLQKKFDYHNIVLLLIGLLGIYTLRFYIFFAFIVAVFGSFIVGTQKSIASTVQQVLVVILISIGLTYFGVLRGAQSNLEVYGSFERLEASRRDMSQKAESGYADDIDVSTPTGALQALPLGFLYLMFAPFPWQVTNLRQSITLPEMFMWWASVPFLISGIWYTLRNKLRESIGVLLFTVLLTVSYSIFQGNVGTAYRMRAQMLIFYFMFVAVGLVVWQEKKENKLLVKKMRRI